MNKLPGLRRSPRSVVDGIAIDVPTRGLGAWIPACAGMTKWGRGSNEGGAGMRRWRAGGEQVAGLRRLPRDVVDRIANVVPLRGVGAWIPACAGMTKGSAGMTNLRRGYDGLGYENSDAGCRRCPAGRL